MSASNSCTPSFTCSNAEGLCTASDASTTANFNGLSGAYTLLTTDKTTYPAGFYTITIGVYDDTIGGFLTHDFVIEFVEPCFFDVMTIDAVSD